VSFQTEIKIQKFQPQRPSCDCERRPCSVRSSTWKFFIARVWDHSIKMQLVNASGQLIVDVQVDMREGDAVHRAFAFKIQYIRVHVNNKKHSVHLCCSTTK
jgi:hypothetical protein